MPDPLDSLALEPGAVGDVVRDQLTNPPLPTETPSDTAGRLYRDSQTKARIQRIRGADLAARDIPAYQDDAGDVQPVRDETGAALTGYDPKNKIAYDSTGNAKKISYDETGGPKLSDPFEGIAPTTAKDGNKYQITPGMPWKWTGQDDDIIAQQKQKEKDKVLTAAQTALGRKLTLDEHDLRTGGVDAKHGRAELAGIVPELAQPQFEGSDLPTVNKAINDHFNAQLGTAQPGMFGGFFGDSQEQAAQKQAAIESQRAAALDKATKLFALKDNLNATKSRVDVARAAAQQIADQRLQSAANKLNTLDASTPAYTQGVDGSISFPPARAYDATVQAARDSGTQPDPESLQAAQETQVDAKKRLSAENAVATKGQKKLYTIGKDKTIDFTAEGRPFDALQQAVADGHVTPEKAAQFEHQAWTDQAIGDARVGLKPYTVGEDNKIALDESKPLDSLNAAVGDGIMPVPPPEVYQAAEAKQKLVEESGSNPKLKAVLAGTGRGAAFLATAPAGAGAGAEIGAFGGPFDEITVPAGAAIGSIITGSIGAWTYGKLLEEVGKYNDTINSFVKAQQLHPYYAAGGELAAFGTGIPKAAMKAAGALAGRGADALAEGSIVAGDTANELRGTIRAAKAAGTPVSEDVSSMASRYLDAIGKAYQGSGGGLVSTLKNLKEQASIMSEGGATAPQIAAKTARDVLTSAAAMVAVDTAVKQGSKALGISEEGQTLGGAGVAAILGAFNAGHGINFPEYSQSELASIIMRGAAHTKAGVGTAFEIPIEKLDAMGVKDSGEAGVLAKPLTPEEHEIYTAFGEKMIEMEGKGVKLDPDKIVLSARQALRAGRAQGVRSVKIEGDEAAGATADSTGLPSTGAPVEPAPGSASPAPAEPTPTTGKKGKGPAAPAETPAPTDSALASTEGTPATEEPASQPLASTFPGGTVIGHGDDEVHIGKENKALTWQAVRAGQIVATGQETNTRAAAQAGKAALDALPKDSNAGQPPDAPGGSSAAVPAPSTEPQANENPQVQPTAPATTVDQAASALTPEQQRIKDGTKRVGDTAAERPVTPARAPEADTFLDKLNPMQRAKAKAALDQQVSQAGKVTTRREIVAARVAAGARIETDEVPDNAATERARREYDQLSKHAPTGNEKHPQTIRLRELKALLDSGGVKVKKRRLTNPDDSFLWESDISKTAMDYAAHLIAKRDAATPSKPAATPSESAIKAKVNTVADKLGANVTFEPTTGANESGIQFANGKIRVDAKKLSATMKRLADSAEEGAKGTPEEWLEKAIREEVWHAGQFEIAKASGKTLEQYFNDVPDEHFPSDWQDQGAKARSDWDKMPKWKQKAEFTRMVAQGEYDGTITEALYRVLADVVKYLKGIARNGSEWMKSYVAELDRRVNGMKPRAEVATPEAPAKPVKPKAEPKTEREPPAPKTLDDELRAGFDMLDSDAPKELTTSEQVLRDRLSELLQKAVQRQIDESRAQGMLDDMQEAGRSPQAVVRDFWQDTYPFLSDAQQRRFQRMVSSVTGLSVGDVVATKKDPDTGEIEKITASSWPEVFSPDATSRDAEYLEGTERGLIALMEAANMGAGKMKQAATPEERLALDADAPTSQQVAIPEQHVPMFLDLARKLAKEVRTPEEFAKRLTSVASDKAERYSEALWDLMGVADKSLRGSHDWAKIYGGEKPAETPTPAAEGPVTPEKKPEPALEPAPVAKPVQQIEPQPPALSDALRSKAEQLFSTSTHVLLMRQQARAALTGLQVNVEARAAETNARGAVQMDAAEAAESLGKSRKALRALLDCLGK